MHTLFHGPALAVEEAALALRPVPGDGLPAVSKFSAGLWLAMMHSGATLGPLVAERLAAEVLGQGNEPLLAPFHPGRFWV